LEDEKQYKEFYLWLFPYFKKESNKFIPTEEATLLWNIVLRERKVAGAKWKFFEQWLEYLEKAKVTSVNANVWEMLWSFMQKYPKDVGSYAEDQTCYPVVFDKFVDYINGATAGEDEDDEDDDL